MITKINVIKQFTSEISDVTYGIYDVTFKGNQEIFIRNGDSVGVVNFFLDRPASECVFEIRDDVKAKFFQRLNSIA